MARTIDRYPSMKHDFLLCSLEAELRKAFLCSEWEEKDRRDHRLY